jgi:hypothetical protein
MAVRAVELLVSGCSDIFGGERHHLLLVEGYSDGEAGLGAVEGSEWWIRWRMASGLLLSSGSGSRVGSGLTSGLRKGLTGGLIGFFCFLND